MPIFEVIVDQSFTYRLLVEAEDADEAENKVEDIGMSAVEENGVLIDSSDEWNGSSNTPLKDEHVQSYLKEGGTIVKGESA